ncbi:acyltransferase [Streptomyces venezuelae]|uniref:Acyltransferase n=1 Tax=Streptomyces venezuelae TaxID=54571 RepID=A0A5P2CZH1_STRVZ|nr:acyltransferase [Streptomyces venezuelae]QES48296.1 acyltransferase [Streptomyces venezuelae]
MSALRPEPRAAQLSSLTGMRFLAALLVFISHVAAARMFTNNQTNADLDKYLGTLGFIGVSFFFILSGFVLTWSAKEGDRPVLFWRRRFAKIYPVHFVTWVGGLLLVLQAGFPMTGKQFYPGLFLTNAWVSDFSVIRGTNGAAWSLCAELLFYLSFPLLLPLLKKIRPGNLWKWAAGAVLGAVAVPALAESLLPHQAFPGLKYDWYQFWAVYFFPAGRLFEFVLGILLARIVMSGRWIPRISLPVAALTLIPGYLLSVYVPNSFALVLPTLIPLGLVVAAGAQADNSGRTGWLGSRPMVWLGEISFSFYMLHMVVTYFGPVDFTSGRQFGVAEAIARAGGWFALTLVLSWVLYRGVELPIMRRWSRPRPKQSATPVVVSVPAPVAVAQDSADQERPVGSRTV